jgi:Protein of unknown function (DUF1064)
MSKGGSSPAAMSVAMSKYRNKRAYVDGIGFHSKLEARCYEWLKGRTDVLWFIRQPRFDLGGTVQYVADFLVVVGWLAEARPVFDVQVIDAKGYNTAMSKTKIKLVEAKYGIKVILWTGK